MAGEMCYTISNKEASLIGNQFFVAQVTQSYNNCGIKPHSDRELVREIGLS